MADEVDPMRDLGLVHDKQVILEPQGILTPSNTTRDLMEHFIPEYGGKLFDLVDRYDAITTLILNNSGTDNGALRYLAPFLKAFDVTDYGVYRYFNENMPVTPGAPEAMRYLMDTMPLFFDSMMYEQAADVICDKTGVPIDVAGSTPLHLDDVKMKPAEAREIRGMAKEICKLRVPKDTDDGSLELTSDEVKLVQKLDEIFQTRLKDGAARELMQSTEAVGLSEKAYALIDIRKSTQVDVDGIMYAGSDTSDFQVLDLVKESNGLAISYNGSEGAVHGSAVALIDTDCTSLAFIGSVFFDTGVQGVLDLADNWNLDYVRSTEFPDMNLRDRMLELHPKGLPEFYRITEQNALEVSQRSEQVRDKLVKQYKMRSAKIKK